MCLYDLRKVKLELTAYLKFLLLLSRKKISHVCSTQPNYSSEKIKVILFNFVAYTGDSFHSHDVRGVVWRFYYYSLHYRFAIFSSHSLSLSLSLSIISFSVVMVHFGIWDKSDLVSVNHRAHGNLPTFNNVLLCSMGTINLKPFECR